MNTQTPHFNSLLAQTRQAQTKKELDALRGMFNQLDNAHRECLHGEADIRETEIEKETAP